MARYRAKAPLFVLRYIVPGEEFDSDLPPGRNWEPLDADAHAAVAKRNTKGDAALAILEPPIAHPGAVDIPADWQKRHGTFRRALAKKLGAQSNVRVADADSFIEAELARRVPAAQMQGAA